MQTPTNPLAVRNTPCRRRKLRPHKSLSSYGYLAQPLNEAGQKRVEDHTWVAYQLAWKFARHYARDIAADELIAEGLYGLTYASSLFKAELGVPFGAYAHMVIRHRLIQCILTWRRARRCRQLPIISTPTGSIELESEARPAPEPGDGMAAKEICDQIRCVLPARLYDVLYLFYGEGRTLREIGSHMGLTRQRVRQLISQAGNRVRQVFPEWTKF